MLRQLCCLCFATLVLVAAGPRKGMVVSQERLASEAGAQVLREGGTAVDAAVATAFALAVTHPIAGNIGGGGFLLQVGLDGRADVYDFREQAPRKATPQMFLVDGAYSSERHHDSWLAVGVPGTVAGLHQAWKAHGKLPWARLVAPAVKLAREGVEVTPTLAASLEKFLSDFRKQPEALAAFSRGGAPLKPGDRLVQRDLAKTLERIQRHGPKGFYEGETARLLAKAVQAGGGILDEADLKAYRPLRREPMRGTYRGHEILACPPPSSGGPVILTALGLLEGFDLKALGRTAPETAHLVSEATRRAFADRAQFLGDPEHVQDQPLAHLLDPARLARLRKGLDPAHASRSDLGRGVLPPEREHTTHLSVVDRAGRAVSLTYTIEDNYGLKKVVPGAGFLLNNEMGDFNAGPGLTDEKGLIGTAPNLAGPGKRMLSSMCPVVVRKDGRLLLVSGSPGGRTIPSITLWTLLGILDFGLDAQAAVDAPRTHHGWFPDAVSLEQGRWPEATRARLTAMGHTLADRPTIGVAQVIRVRPDGSLEGGADRTRWAESAAVAE